MKFSGPVAIINGIDKFGAKFLAKELMLKDIFVVGVGEFVLGLEETDNFKWVGELEDYGERVNYVFDFEGDEKIFDLVSENEAKLTVVCVNNPDRAAKIRECLKTKEVNWRLVEANGVYGPGMVEGEEEGLGVGFLTEAIKQAVSNVNLVLPTLGTKFRLLSVVDLVEAVLRASFLSGTEREDYLILGEETDTAEVAKVLIDEAKMTRFKVLQKDYVFDYPSKLKIEGDWKKLRWQPEIGFKKGIVETLQYFFSVIDEENRKKMKKGEEKIIEDKKEKKEGVVENNHRRFEVFVEEEKEIEKPKKSEEKEIFEKVEVVDEEKIKREEEEKKKKEKERREKEEVAERYKKELEEEFLRAEEKKKEKAEEKNEILEDIKSLSKKYQQPVEVTDEVVEEEDVETKEWATEREHQLSMMKNKRRLRIKINFKLVSTVVVLLIFLTILSVPVGWGWTVFSGVKNMETVKKYIEEEKYPEAEKIVEVTMGKLEKIDSQIDDWGLNRIQFLRNFQVGLKVGKEILVIEKKAIPMAIAAGNVSEAVFKEKEIGWEEELTNLSNSLAEMDTEIGLLQARLSGDWSWLPNKWRPELQKGLKDLETARRTIETSKEGIKITRELLGTDGKRREYLVLLQNENELRAGGGFIGSYGILSFEDGKLLNLDIRDIYEADGQLKGHVEPPSEIKQFLGEAGWFMRDSNWKVDFVEANKDIEWFLEKETGRRVDGVIGINLAVARAVLDVTGPVYVTDFNEKINKDNLYEQAQFYAENKFFPGSKQKASFLGGLGRQLFEEIRNLDPEKMLQLYLAVLEQLNKNEIQVVLHEKNAAKIIADLGWDGAVYQGKCLIERCYADYLYLSESNFGVNKANYYIYRNIEQVVDITPMAISRVLKINYENTAKNKSWPGGDYKNYLRAYIPADSNLAEVSISDPSQPGKKTVVSGANLKVSQVYGKKEVGFLVLVPVNQKRIVEIRYVNKLDLGSKDKFSYLGYIQKQSGYGETGFVSLISFPEGWQPIQVQPAASVVNGKLLFNTKLDVDIKMGVELGK